MERSTIQISLPAPRSSSSSGGPSWKKYRFIPLPRRFRRAFPAYKKPFVLDTDSGHVEVWISSGGRESENYLEGGYIVGVPRKYKTTAFPSLAEWYGNHKELEAGTILEIRRVGENVYSLHLRVAIPSQKLETENIKTITLPERKNHASYVRSLLEKYTNALPSIETAISVIQELPDIEDSLSSLEGTRSNYMRKLERVARYIDNFRELMDKPDWLLGIRSSVNLQQYVKQEFPSLYSQLFNVGSSVGIEDNGPAVGTAQRPMFIGPEGIVYSNLTTEQIREIVIDYIDRIGR